MSVFKIHHITKYQYNRPVKESMNEIKIFPYPCNEQEILNHEIFISANPELQRYTDYWGNVTGTFSLIPPHTELIIESKLTVRTLSSSQLKINFHSNWKQLENEINENLQLIELACGENIKAQIEIEKIANTIFDENKSVAAVVEQCSEYIFKYFKYIKGITNIETTVDDILVHRSGVCQDFAHLMLQILRTINIPSRYVSGYICPNKNGMRGEGATHAWVEAWIPQYGWAGIDPTNNVWVTNNHIKLAVGRHFSDCSPIKGAFKGPAKQELSVYVSVGYEDGQTFEEMNNVRMETLPPDKAEEIFAENFAGQQQQQ